MSGPEKPIYNRIHVLCLCVQSLQIYIKLASLNLSGLHVCIAPVYEDIAMCHTRHLVIWAHGKQGGPSTPHRPACIRMMVAHFTP